MNTFYRYAMNAKESVYQQIYKQVTGKEFIPGDHKEAAKFTIIQKQGVFDRELVQWNGITLGAVIMCIEGCKITFIFDPDVKGF